MPRQPTKATVRPEDELTCNITITGLLGFDLETVAGREEARRKMIESATAQVDTWLDLVEVVPDRRKR